MEGDSAAVAELVAILSSLSDVAVRQYFAVTGSVNQLGEIQPIGGVNEKIEGFFESCRKHGLSGTRSTAMTRCGESPEKQPASWQKKDGLLMDGRKNTAV